MYPEDFKEMVYKLADKVGFPKSNIILGGDHLGPLVWCNEHEETAMQKAEDLVRAYVAAGYTKIHLDTSMRLADDSREEPLALSSIARRGARLYLACEEEYKKLLEKDPKAEHPVYIIGSEVPIPGGEQSETDTISVTKVEDLEKMLAAYQKEFDRIGMPDAMDNVVGIVVQPGVEFGDENIAYYNRHETVDLCNAVKKYPGLVMEGHSTDYQPTFHLREMVTDGIAILKVGPALTYALREALFALSMIETELFPKEEQSWYMDVLDAVMVEDDSNWNKYYRGTEHEIRLKRKYSLSDRCRYYLQDKRIDVAMNKLFDNINSVKIPHGLLRQFMPNQYIKVREGVLKCEARELVKDHIIEVVEEYNYATKCNYYIYHPTINVH